MPDQMTEFHKRIVRLGLSQVDAARLFGVHPITMNRYCHDQNVPPPVMALIDLCENVPGALARLRERAIDI